MSIRLEPYNSPDVPFRDYYSAITYTLDDAINCKAVDFEADDMQYTVDFMSSTKANKAFRESFNSKIVARYGMRELGIIPVRRWKQQFVRVMNEQLPKYAQLYRAKYTDFLQTEAHTETQSTTGTSTTNESGKGTSTGTNTSKGNTSENGSSTTTFNTNVATDTDTYNKGREINSDFPQSQLAGNSDYATTGKDFENETTANANERKTGTESTKTTDESTSSNTTNTSGNTTSEGTSKTDESGTLQDDRISYGDVLEKYIRFAERYKHIDVLLLDELEPLFTSLVTVNVNGY